MKKSKKMILVSVVAAATLAGGSGAAMAATGGDPGADHARQTETHRTAHSGGAGSVERGLSQVKADDGRPGLHVGGTEPSNGGIPETHTSRAR